MRKLNPKQRLFVSEYLKDKNGTQAAIRAGYSKTSAYSISSALLKKDEIKSSLEAALNRIESENESCRKKISLTPQYVIDALMEVVQRCLQREAVMEFDYDEKRLVQVTEMNERNQEVGVWKFDASGANKALELLGRTQKMFTDRIEVGDKSSFAEILKKARQRANEATKSRLASELTVS